MLCFTLYVKMLRILATVYGPRHTILRTMPSDIEASYVQFCCCNYFMTVYTNLNICDSVTYSVIS